jgi:hypothetical protein
LSFESVFSRAGEWFVRSGIQTADGGVARYYRTDLERNLAASTEITGYAVSALLFLDRPANGLQAAGYLVRAWNGKAMPFELAPERQLTYFFDCGIIVRGLLAAWRASRQQEFLEVAVAVGRAMMTDFAAADGNYEAILELPEKRPAPRNPSRWSQAPGCYQLKSGLGWWDLFEATGETRFREAYDGLLETALRCHRTFLPGHPDPLKVVDRLHAFLYFLEGLLPRASDEACTAAIEEGIERVACHLAQFAPQFERSDVYAQLLRVRLYADEAGVVPLDRGAAEKEARTLAEFQAASEDARIDGGFYFGRKAGSWLPYVNPVSTAFAVQALALWQAYRTGSTSLPCHRLI